MGMGHLVNNISKLSKDIELFDISKCDIKYCHILYHTIQNQNPIVPHYSMSHCALQPTFQQFKPFQTKYCRPT